MTIKDHLKQYILLKNNEVDPESIFSKFSDDIKITFAFEFFKGDEKKSTMIGSLKDWIDRFMTEG